MIDFNVIISVISVSAALLFGYAAFSRNNRADNSALVSQLAQFQATLEFVKQQVMELSKDQALMTASIEELRREIAVIKTESANLRHDIDRAHEKLRTIAER